MPFKCPPMQFMLNFVATLFMFGCLLYVFLCRLLGAPSIPNNSHETYDCVESAAAEQTANAFSVFASTSSSVLWPTAVANKIQKACIRYLHGILC